MEFLNTMYNIMKIITCSVVPQANVASNLSIHVNPSKHRKLDRGVDKSEYRLESVRLKSFEHWPCSWITAKSVAAAGFYYTGTRDTVKCFDCDIDLTEWEKDDDPMIEHKRSSARCRFVRNIPCGNVPIGTDPSTIPPVVRENDICGPYSASRPKHSKYDNYDDRYSSFATWPKALSHLKETLADAGLFYTGNLDETICFQCGGVLKNWESGDDPWEAVAKYHENCSYVRKTKGSDWVNKNIERMRNPKLIPEHPEYVDYDVRLASFGSKWPEALSHLKKTLVAAGLFYTGNLDETDCFQCGGGLRDWESGDDPWEEHAKHHKNCSYVRSVKGSNWVNDIIGRMGNPKLETVESSTNDKLDVQFKEAENTGAASGSSHLQGHPNKCITEMTDCIGHYIPPPPNRLPSNSPIKSHIEEFDETDSSNYRLESARLESFRGWPCPWMKPEKLTAAGFYYTGQSDKVKCFECRVELCDWQADDNPMVDHQRWSGRCGFVRNIPCGNVPIGTDPSTIPASVPEGMDVCGPYGLKYMPYSAADQDREVEEKVDYKLRGLTARPKHPEYATYDARFESFDTWPKAMSQTKEELATAGFYYTGSGDQTLCYHCGGGLRDWMPDDVPWVEHAKWFDYCPYLLLIKGKEFVSKITGKNR